MKEYKNNEQLIEYLISKDVIINDKEQALKNVEKYSEKEVYEELNKI